MSQVSEQDVITIKDWLAKEPSLPKNFDDLILKKFIYSCHNSLERTKTCLEDFCTRRANMPELFTNRDPTAKKMMDVYNTTVVATYKTDKDEILIHRLSEESVETFDFYSCLKSFMVQADNWVQEELGDRTELPENHIVVADIKHFALSLIPKSNIFFLQKFIIFLLESMPIRLSNVHIINCPPFYEYMYGLIKPVLPKHTVEMIRFHPDHTGLYDYIDKKYLPLEYGGEAGSMVEQSSYWVNIICGRRQFYLNDNLWKTDLSKKPKKDNVETAMSGSFRTLLID